MNVPSSAIASSLTDEQRAAAHAPHSVAVTAGAGTGKTHMLAERYLFHLEHLKLSPLNLVAVTFTNDAAAELRSRIRRQLSKAFGPESDEVAEVDVAQISTIHNLAARICREQADGLGIPPDFTILETIEGKLWRQEQLDLAFHQLHQNHPEIYEIFSYTRLRRMVECLLENPLKARQGFICTQADWLGALVALQQQTADTLLKQPAWIESLAIIETHQPHRTDKLEEYCALALEGRDLLLAGRYGEAVTAIAAIKINCGAPKNWGKETLAMVKQALKQLRDSIKDGQLTEIGQILSLSPNEVDQKQEIHKEHLKIAFEYIFNVLDQAKKKEKKLEFNDLEIYALQALGSADVRRYYQQRWKAYLVDEFQDTNGTQGQLLEQLTADAIVTIVGDDKQAIYGFRGGDVNVFRQWRDRVTQAAMEQGNQAAVGMTQSFRSHRSLVQATNAVFRPILGELHQDLRTDREAPEHPYPVEFHYLDLHKDDLPEEVTLKRRNLGQSLEAHWLAQTIQNLHEDGLAWRDVAILGQTWKDLRAYERALKRLNIPTYLASSGNLLETREALDAIALLRFMADTRDNLALIALLRSPFFAVSDRVLYQTARKLSTQQSSLFNGMQADRHSPIHDPANESLDVSNKLPEGLSRSGKPLIWWEGLKTLPLEFNDPEIRPKLNSDDQIQPIEWQALTRAIAILRELRHQCRRIHPTQLLQLADRETGYTAAIANLDRPEPRLAHWQGIYELVRQLQGSSRNLFSVVRVINALMARQAAPWENAQMMVPTPPLEVGDVVILQTIHGSKGLEWPVVFLPDLSKQKKTSVDSIFVDEHLGLAWKEGEIQEMNSPEPEDDQGSRPYPQKALQASHYQLLKFLQKRAEAEELKRLYYVGFTRARDRVYLSSQVPQKAGTALEFLGPALDAAQLKCEVITPNFSALESNLSTPEFAPEPQLSGLKFSPQAAGSGLTEIPVIGLGIYGQCPRWFHYQIIEQRPWYGDLEEGFTSAETDRDLTEEPLRDLDAFDAWNEEKDIDLAFLKTDMITSDDPKRSRGARSIGRLTHLALEHHCTEPLALKQLAQQHRERATPENLIAAIALAKTFWETPIYQPFWKPFQQPLGEGNHHGIIQQEVPLKLPLGPITLVGIADYVGPDFVLDFKTGERHPEHDFQVWAYGQALGRDRAALAYLGHQTLVELDAPRKKALAQQAQQLAQDISQGDFGPQPHGDRCPTCPYLDLCDDGQAIAPPEPSP